MPAIPSELTHRLYETLLRCGPFDSDRTLRPLFVDARLSAWRDLLPETGSRVERARAIVDALSERENPNGDNALVLLLRVIAENTPPGDACRGHLAALAEEVEAVLRAGASSVSAPPVQPPRGGAAAQHTVFNQPGQQVGTQINVAGNYYPGVTSPASVAAPGVAAMPCDMPTLRARLQRLDAVEIESLCLDHFPVVYDKFARGLQRGEMINLLLDHCRRNPDDAARLAKL